MSDAGRAAAPAPEPAPAQAQAQAAAAGEGDAGGDEEDTRQDAAAGDAEEPRPGAGGVSGLLRKILATARDASESLVRPAEVVDAAKEASVAHGTNPQTLRQEMDAFFGSVDAYAKLELKDALSDFECLEQMNRVSYAKYGELASTLGGLSGIQKDMQDKYEEMQPVLEEVDRLHATVLDLERVVEHLENYSERLVVKATSALQ